MNIQRPFKVMISDLDGTLLNEDHKLGDFTVETLTKLAKININIILATGRCFEDVSLILKSTHLRQVTLITSNGARAHTLQGELLYHSNIDENIAYQLLNYSIDNNLICINSYQDEGWFIDQDIPELKHYHPDSIFSYQLTDFKQHHSRGVEKIFYLSHSPEALDNLEKKLTAEFGEYVNITFSTPRSLEIMNKNVSKASTLAKIIPSLNCQLTDCIAFGDGLNDKELLSEVGKGCIMGNADVRLKKQLPHLEHIGLHQHESVASYLRAIFALID